MKAAREDIELAYTDRSKKQRQSIKMLHRDPNEEISNSLYVIQMKMKWHFGTFREKV